MEFLSKLVKFLFGLFLMGLVFSFAVEPAVEQWLEGVPSSDRELAERLVAVGGVAAVYGLGFVWSLMGEVVWDMLPSAVKWVFGAITIVGLAFQLFVLAGAVLMMTTIAASGDEATRAAAAFAGAGLALIIIVLLLVPLVFWLGYIWFPLNLLNRGAGTEPSIAGETPGNEQPSARVRRTLSQYAPPTTSSTGMTPDLRPGESLLDRARRAQRRPPKDTSGGSSAGMS